MKRSPRGLPRVFEPSLAVIFLLLANLPALSSAPKYELTGTIIGSSGGTSKGGSFVLTGAVAQPDTGLLAGGQFQLSGGVLENVLVVPLSGGPSLALSVSKHSLVISWPATAQGFVLQSAKSLSSSPIQWEAVSTAAVMAGNQLTVTIELTGENQFFRLRGQ